jgi:hypothetical protein
MAQGVKNKIAWKNPLLLSIHLNDADSLMRVVDAGPLVDFSVTVKKAKSAGKEPRELKYVFANR